MQNFVQFVSDSNYETFIARDPENYKVLLFTERKSTAPLFKALSKKYKGKLNFGEVRNNPESQVIKNYKIEKFPAIVVVLDAKSYEREIYEGEMNADRLSLFFSGFSYKKAKKVKALEWQELTHLSYKTGTCNKKGASNCFIVCSKGLTAALESLPQQLENDKVDFVYFSSESGCKEQLVGFEAAFLKPKFAKVYGIETSQLQDPTIVAAFVENIIGGGGSLSGKLADKELKF